MLRVGIIMGGNSTERDVSIMSGNEFIKHLDKEKYAAVPIVIDVPKDILKFADDFDVALLALHGKNGEDGKVQALLEALEIPYTGSGIVGSAICMDKNMSKLVMRSKGLLTPDWVMAKSGMELDIQFFEGLSLPVIIKPNQGGSSIGIRLVETWDGILPAVREVFAYDEEVVVETFIRGQEITCSMLNGKIIPVLSIEPNMTFFGYEDKYADDGAREEVLVLPEAQLKEVAAAAEACWELFRLKSYARIDMIIEGGKPWIIEINTLPGMTRYSLLPKSVAAMGGSFSQFLDQIIQEAL